jgi:hypothetical protein
MRALAIEMFGEPVQDTSEPWAENTYLRRGSDAGHESSCFRRLVADYRRGEAVLGVMKVSV